MIADRIRQHAQDTPSGVLKADVDFPEVRGLMAAEMGRDPDQMWGCCFPVGFNGTWHHDGGKLIMVYYPYSHDTPLEFDHGIVHTEAGLLHAFDGNKPHRIGLIEHEPRYSVCGRYV